MVCYGSNGKVVHGSYYQYTTDAHTGKIFYGTIDFILELLL